MKTKHTLILAALLAFNSNAFALSPLTIGDAKQHFSKPYLEFVNAWMPQDLASKFLSLGTKGAANERKSFYSESVQKLTTNATGTFKAYCEANGGVFEQYSHDTYCMSRDSKNTALNFMTWTNDGRNVTFRHKSNEGAQNEYKNVVMAAKIKVAKADAIKVGNKINTVYGPGLVIEKKDGGLFLFQSVKSDVAPRWMSTDDVSLTVICGYNSDC